MKVLPKIKKIILSTVIVLSIITYIVPALAYWDAPYNGIFTSNTEVTVTIGEWITVSDWNENTTYTKGDKVTHDGSTYEARRTSTGWEPGSGWFWWYFWTKL